ncbi:hypothetical protein EZS27_020202 [termite gut metagenome]|uniref:Uncharacterized protein n=1 Tax=termite gut metagenome TaxID=433724 RepID=A0A5J4RE66_9ZZZZ
MVRATHAISVRFDEIVKNLGTTIDTEMNVSKENLRSILRKMDEVFGEQKATMQDISKKLNLLYHFQKDNTNLLLKVMALYAELASCGLTDGKQKERLKEDIDKLLSPKL